MKLKILFVCGRNRWRSPTAERIYRQDERIRARSAGMSGKSPHPVSRVDLEWADLVLVMEAEYKARLAGMFPGLKLPAIHSLDIPDEYEFMDEELITLIKSGTEYHIGIMTG